MIEIGLGLWSMQNTAAAPASWASLYAAIPEEARLAEALGFDELWFAEHRFWYDGWCPQPLVAAAAAAGATTTLRVGTAMHLLPQHDPTRVAVAVAALDRSSAGRLDLGVGLGYRHAEYDGVGLPLRRRGRLMDQALDRLIAEWNEAAPPLVQQPHPRVWVGGTAQKANDRAARPGLALMLPPTLRAEEVRDAVARAGTAAAAAGLQPGPVGIMKDVWVDHDAGAARAHFIPRTTSHYREYAGAWWELKGRPGFEVPDLLDKQMARPAATMIVGTPDDVVAELLELHAAGVEVFGLQIHSDVTRDRWRDVAALIAAEVLPTVRQEAARQEAVR
jgi:alkanesulfonate monooxygenase SsuD/methylene tetrahydromethanopterin reductase-like flavin-dependent oxidoreductase (luciferase family)